MDSDASINLQRLSDMATQVLDDMAKYLLSTSGLVVFVVIFVVYCVCCRRRDGRDQRDVNPVPYDCLYIGKGVMHC